MLKKPQMKSSKIEEEKMRKKTSIIFIIMLISFILVSCGNQPTYKHQKIKKIDTGVDSNSWVLIPKGNFYFGQFTKIPDKIDYDYEIMVTDVTNSMFADYLNKALFEGKIKIEKGKVVGYYKGEKYYGFRHELKIPEGDNYPYFLLNEPGVRIRFEKGKFLVDEGFENHPATLVTWFGANAYCKYYGWELPTEKEWEKAARGETKNSYPWGEEINKEYVNYIFSNKEIRKKIFSVNYQITTPVGFFNGKTYNGYKTKSNASPYGLYDMSGNVWQWIKDRYPKMSDRFMKGGSFRDYEIYLRVWDRNSAQPSYGAINIGFRCVRKPVKKSNEIKETVNKKGESN